MRELTATAFVLAAGLGTCLSASADTIVLKNGRVFEGRIVEHTGSRITLRVGEAGTVTFRLREIERIRKDDRDGARMIEDALKQGVTVHRDRRTSEGRAALPEGPGGPPAPSVVPPVAATALPPVSPATERAIEQAIERLGATGGGAARGVRRDQAIEALVEIGGPAVPALAQALSFMPNWFTRSNAARALEEIAQGSRDPATNLALWRAAPELIRRVETDPERWVRVNANEALAAITGHRIAPVDPSAAGTSVPDVPPEAGAQWQTRWSGIGAAQLADLERSLGSEPREGRALPAGEPLRPQQPPAQPGVGR